MAKPRKKSAKKKIAHKSKLKKPSLGKRPSKVSTKTKKSKSSTSKKSLKDVSSKAEWAAYYRDKRAKQKALSRIRIASPFYKLDKLVKADRKSSTSKKSLKVESSKAKAKQASYTLITLDAKTRKVVTPKKGQQIFYAWKDARGKIYPIESKYSQGYLKSDSDGIKAAFKAGSATAYNVYKVLTSEVSKVVDSEGNLVDETVTNKKTGEVKTLYRWKITGRSFKKGVSVSIQNVKDGFFQTLTKGFPKLEPHEIATGDYIKVPVEYIRSRKAPDYPHIGRFRGKTIREMLSHIVPDVTTETLIRKGIRVLHAEGYITIIKPENPYLEDTTDWHDREKWAIKIWKDSDKRRFKVSAIVPTLMDFASRAATQFRKAFSSHGLRVTSLVDLEEAVANQKHEDKTTFKFLPPVWPNIMEHPESGVRYKLSAKGKEGKFVSADKYHPLHYEENGETLTHRAGSKYETVFDLHLTIKGFKR